MPITFIHFGKKLQRKSAVFSLLIFHTFLRDLFIIEFLFSLVGAKPEFCLEEGRLNQKLKYCCSKNALFRRCGEQTAAARA